MPKFPNVYFTIENECYKGIDILHHNHEHASHTLP